MIPASGFDAGKWIGVGSTSVAPPVDYWTHLAGEPPDRQVEELKRQFDSRLTEFTASALPPPDRAAVDLLDRVADDGWLERAQRPSCPNCKSVLTNEEAAELICPQCGEAYSQHGRVVLETIYTRNLTPGRDVDWVIAIHGMNTAGAWQEAFSWHLSTTWGRSVPVAVYKYGIVIAGVIMAWRRDNLRYELRDKLATLRDEARAQGFDGNPDVVAHSFGTWLFGHLLERELARPAQDRLRFGRVILTGCVLRPDFDWQRFKTAELVEDVLNHYGTRDIVVPLAHAVIWDSGPSGRRGFDGDQVVNVRAAGYGHSDLFSIEKYVVKDSPFKDRTGAPGEMSHLEHSYRKYWRPFLTLPRDELGRLADVANPPTPWRQLLLPLRGLLFPFFALPLAVVLVALLVLVVGKNLWELREVLTVVAKVSAAGLGLLLASIALTWLWRRLWG